MSDRTFDAFDAPLLPSPERGLTRSTAGVPRVPHLAPPGVGGAPRAPASRHAGMWAMLRAAWRRHRTRQYITGLDPYLLKDIGVSYAEAEAEANKPFWMA